MEDPALRLRFLRAAEALSLLLGLLGDAGLKASRWRDATRALLARPLNPQVGSVNQENHPPGVNHSVASYVGLPLRTFKKIKRIASPLLRLKSTPHSTLIL